ncbi:SOS response-associated peptidase [Halomicrobium sp. LC1Hm]|uniref:SOS response-associated peptidase n=1 Tax=Halomicrobium sp. LC1Hm TaxID=2610902 RepID=UPI00129830B1|nr:SOS response-associated peptidase [Halomicrobium sp. LC1Hm]QGA81624.1 Putative SOS response-associated peptidase YedK [Halomicrobium sp. LC1Hm]
MCGRYSLFAPREDIEARFGATFAQAYEPRYNAAPRQSLPVITADEPETIQRMEWGLIPSWADDRSEFEFINARAETVTEKRSFAEAYERRRCLVPADGFYEWRAEGSEKQPYRVTRDDQRPFAMAGLWERWRPPQRQAGLGEFGTQTDGAHGETTAVETFTILTTEPNEFVRELHHRMSVILDPGEETIWLHGDADERRALLEPYDGELAARPVSTAVNDPSNDSPAVLDAPGV